MSDDILTGEQRRDLAAYTNTSVDLNDAELLTHAAQRMGMEGELAVDPDGVLELELDGITVVLESVAEEDREQVEHPDLLHVAVLLRAPTPAEQAALRDADLIDEDTEAHDESGEWLPAWWGSICTRLPVGSPISTQLEALNRVMQEAHAVLSRRDVAGFFDRIAWLQLDDEDEEEEGEE